MSIYLVIFGKPRYLGITDMEDVVPKKGSRIIIETMRGIETGIVAGALTGDQQEKFRNICKEEPSEGQNRGEPLLQNVKFVEFPDEDDRENMEELARSEEEVLQKSRQILAEHGLSMKIVDVEFIHERKKLFFYFTSEQRVDFRAYVRDLAREFKTRIELRQIGVRDEAKTVKGLGPCGQPCCCSYWLQSFSPICIKMVKEQNLALNPTKISGICGRLMCCMSYEHPTYHDLWKSLPKPDSKIKTTRGNLIVNGVDIKTSSIKLRSPEGKEFLVPVVNFEDVRKRISKGETLENIMQEKEETKVIPESIKPGAVAGPASDIFSSPFGKIPIKKKTEKKSGPRAESDEKEITQPAEKKKKNSQRNKSRRGRKKKPKTQQSSGQQSSENKKNGENKNRTRNSRKPGERENPDKPDKKNQGVKKKD